MPIRDVVVGDDVLTHKGRWRSVTKTFVNEHDGKLHQMRAHHLGRIGPRVTDNHPILVEKRYTDNWVARDGRSRFRGRDAKPKNNGILEAVRQKIIEDRRGGDTLLVIGERYGVSQASVSLMTRGLRDLKRPQENEVGWVGAGWVLPGWRLFVPSIPAIENAEDIVLNCL